MTDNRSLPALPRIPGPRGLDKWRIVPEMLSLPHECLLRLALTYGDITELDFPNEYAVLVSSAEYIEHLFHENHKNYDKQTHRWATFRQLWGNGLLTADGELWRQQRMRIQPAFHQECMQSFAAIVVEESVKMRRRWAASAAAGEPRDVYPDMLQVAVRTITRATFGADIESKAELVIRAVADTHDYINPVSVSSLSVSRWPCAGGPSRDSVAFTTPFGRSMKCSTRSSAPGRGAECPGPIYSA